jgi:hypothetical protein
LLDILESVEVTELRRLRQALGEGRVIEDLDPDDRGQPARRTLDELPPSVAELPMQGLSRRGRQLTVALPGYPVRQHAETSCFLPVVGSGNRLVGFFPVVAIGILVANAIPIAQQVRGRHQLDRGR